MFLADVIEHLQTLNVDLRGKETNITDLSQTVFSFEAKHRLCVYDIENKILNLFHE